MIAARMLNSDESASAECIRDALGEICNMVAGAFKATLWISSTNVSSRCRWWSAEKTMKCTSRRWYPDTGLEKFRRCPDLGHTRFARSLAQAAPRQILPIRKPVPAGIAPRGFFSRCPPLNRSKCFLAVSSNAPRTAFWPLSCKRPSGRLFMDSGFYAACTGLLAQTDALEVTAKISPTSILQGTRGRWSSTVRSTPARVITNLHL